MRDNTIVFFVFFYTTACMKLTECINSWIFLGSSMLDKVTQGVSAQHTHTHIARSLNRTGHMTVGQRVLTGRLSCSFPSHTSVQWSFCPVISSKHGASVSFQPQLFAPLPPFFPPASLLWDLDCGFACENLITGADNSGFMWQKLR